MVSAQNTLWFLLLSLSSYYWPSGISEGEIPLPTLRLIAILHYIFREFVFNNNGRDLSSGALWQVPCG